MTQQGSSTAERRQDQRVVVGMLTPLSILDHQRHEIARADNVYISDLSSTGCRLFVENPTARMLGPEVMLRFRLPIKGHELYLIGRAIWLEDIEDRGVVAGIRLMDVSWREQGRLERFVTDPAHTPQSETRRQTRRLERRHWRLRAMWLVLIGVLLGTAVVFVVGSIWGGLWRKWNERDHAEPRRDPPPVIIIDRSDSRRPNSSDKRRYDPDEIERLLKEKEALEQREKMLFP